MYIKYFKPRGVVCTTDMKIKKNIVEAVAHPERIFPVCIYIYIYIFVCVCVKIKKNMVQAVGHPETHIPGMRVCVYVCICVCVCVCVCVCKGQDNIIEAVRDLEGIFLVMFVCILSPHM